MTPERDNGSSAGADAFTVTIGCYPTAKSLPLLAGISEGVFQRYGITPVISFQENSRKQRDALAEGTFDIIHMAVDNAVSMVEDDDLDVIVVAGGDSGMNDLYVQPEITDIAGLRGKRLVVDAVDTAYALQAIKILADHGLQAGQDYTLDPVGRGELRIAAMQKDKSAAGAVLNPPYSLQAEDAGFRSLGKTAQLLGGYQASGCFVLRRWALSHRAVLTRYLAAYLRSLRMIRQPARRAKWKALLCEGLRLEPSIARRSLDQLLDPESGLATDAAFDLVGFDKVLELRALTTGAADRRRSTATSATRNMVDLSFYDDACALLDREGHA